MIATDNLMCHRLRDDLRGVVKSLFKTLFVVRSKENSILPTLFN